MEPRMILAAKAYIAAAYPQARVIASSPAIALEELAKANRIVREAWTDDEWVNGWVLAMVHVVRERAGDFAEP